MANLLAQKAVLAHVAVSSWSARRHDRAVTDEVNRSRGAAADAGRYNKLLIDKSALEKLNSISGEARQIHYQMTQPWLDNGSRILPTALYMDYQKKLKKLEHTFNEEADEFARVYPRHVDAARRRLNGMFNEADYPAASNIRDRFAFELKILPCPDKDDFRCDLAAEHAADIRADVEARMKKALDDAMGDVFTRINDTVGHMAARLKEYKPAAGTRKKAEGIFRDSLVQNVRDLVELLPAFNLTNDPRLDKITDRIKRDLCPTDAQILRDNKKARESVASAADAILAQVSAFAA